MLERKFMPVNRNGVSGRSNFASLRGTRIQNGIGVIQMSEEDFCFKIRKSLEKHNGVLDRRMRNLSDVSAWQLLPGVKGSIQQSVVRNF